MDIIIDDIAVPSGAMLFDNVPRKAILPKVQRKRTQKQLTKTEKATIERFQDAYKRVYGMRPEVKVQGKWYSVHGMGYRVSRMRLKEMAMQLEYRAGP